MSEETKRRVSLMVGRRIESVRDLTLIEIEALLNDKFDSPVSSSSGSNEGDEG